MDIAHAMIGAGDAHVADASNFATLPDQEFARALIGHAASLARFARLLEGGPDADDLSQETMLRCWTARQSFRAGTHMLAWARVVMRNCFLSARRRERFHAELPDEAIARLLHVDESQEVAVELQDAKRALMALPPNQRDAVMLAALGLPIAEAATRLFIPEGTFKSRVLRGRCRLRDMVENREAAPVPKPAPRRRKRDWKNVMIG